MQKFPIEADSRTMRTSSDEHVEVYCEPAWDSEGKLTVSVSITVAPVVFNVVELMPEQLEMVARWMMQYAREAAAKRKTQGRTDDV